MKVVEALEITADCEAVAVQTNRCQSLTIWYRDRTFLRKLTFTDLDVLRSFLGRKALNRQV